MLYMKVWLIGQVSIKTRVYPCMAIIILQLKEIHHRIIRVCKITWNCELPDIVFFRDHFSFVRLHLVHMAIVKLDCMR